MDAEAVWNEAIEAAAVRVGLLLPALDVPTGDSHEKYWRGVRDATKDAVDVIRSLKRGGS